MFWASQPTRISLSMPSKGGGGGSVQAPSVGIPSGLWQTLSNTSGLASYGQNSLNTLSGLGNWAAGIATGGQNTPIGSFQSTATQTGPDITIGSGGDRAIGHYTWSTSFDPQTGQITFTNEQTGGQFQEAVNSPQAQQYFANQGGGQATLDQWMADYKQAQTNQGAGTGESQSAWYNSLGPSLQTAWNQIQSIGNIEQQTQNFTNQAQGQENQLYAEGQRMLHDATTGSGLFPSQQAFVNQAVEAQQQQQQQTLAAEGLGTSTSADILRGEAAQQGAATAGQLVQGNIAAAQNQINLAQAAQKMVLAGQTLSLGEASAMAGLAAGFQSQMYSEALQSYQTLGQMMSTVGALYGVDVTGYSNILQASIAQGQLSLQAELGVAQQQASGMASLGSGLGSIFGLLGSTGALGGGGGAAAAGGAAAGGGGLLGSIGGGIGSLIGGAGSGIGSIIGALGGLIAAF